MILRRIALVAFVVLAGSCYAGWVDDYDYAYPGGASVYWSTGYPGYYGYRHPYPYRAYGYGYGYRGRPYGYGYGYRGRAYGYGHYGRSYSGGYGHHGGHR